MNRSSITASFAAVVIALGLGACTSDDNSTGDSPSRSPDGSNGARPVDSGPFFFGETYVGRRCDITVSKPKPWDPPQWMHTGPRTKRLIVLKITAHNRRARVLHDYDWQLSASVDGHGIPDKSNGLSEAFWPDDAHRGESTTWKVAFGLPSAAPVDLTVKVTYGLTPPNYWQGRV